MLQNTQIPSLMFLFIKKGFSFHNGALFLLSAPFGVSISEALKALFKDVSARDVHLPIFSAGLVLFLFSFFYIMDFFTGLAASRKEAASAQKDDFVESAKLWRSFWKLFGYMTLLVFLCGFCIAFAVIDNSFFYNIFLYGILSIGFLFSMFEFHSIGENWKRMYGSKHSIFLFFDKIAKTVETKIIEKINNIL